MHGAARDFVSACVAMLPPRRSVVEYGSRDVNGGVRDLFPAAAYTGIDILPGVGVDVIASATTWRPHELVDTVVSTETLQYVKWAGELCANAHASLAREGVFIVTAAGVGRDPNSGVDGGPPREGEYYRHVTEELLKEWLAPFRVAFIKCVFTDIYAFAVK